MTDIKRSKRSVKIELDRGTIYISGYRLHQNTIDSLSHTIFYQINEYLRQQFTFITFEVHHKTIKLYIGQYVVHNQTFGSFQELIIKHLKQSVPKNIDWIPISGYYLPVWDKSEITITDNLLQKSNGELVQYSALSSLDITEYNSKILKMLLEDQNISILFSNYHQSKPSQYLTIKITGTTKKEIGKSFDNLVMNLKKSPYLSGSLNKITNGSLRSNPGMIAMGMTDKTIKISVLNQLLQIIPQIMKVPSPQQPIPAYPLIEFNSVTGSQKKSSDIEVEEAIEGDVSIQRIPQALLDELDAKGWRIIEEHNEIDYQLIKLQNEQVIIGLILTSDVLEEERLTALVQQEEIMFLMMIDSQSDIVEINELEFLPISKTGSLLRSDPL